MERGGIWGRERVMSELHQGIKLVGKLKTQLHHSNSSSCGFLIEEILSCYDNALALLNYMDSLQTQDSTTLLDFTPTAQVDHQNHVVADVPKKRKSLSMWSEEVLENQHEDGYNWRKYGQKDILGATHPRSYYRCTFRHSQGCTATKQVQREEDDPRILKIVYRGNHSCVVKQNEENVKGELKPQNLEAQPLSEPTLESYFSMSPYNLNNFTSFFNTDSFPFGDLDFSIDDVDFDASLVEVCDPFSHLQDFPTNKI